MKIHFRNVENVCQEILATACTAPCVPSGKIKLEKNKRSKSCWFN